MRHSIAWPRMHDRTMQYILATSSPAAMQDLALHQVNVSNHFRNRMLHLNAGIHLDEVQACCSSIRNSIVPAFSYPIVGQRLAEDASDLLAQLRRHLQGRRLLQQLLMSPLDGALAFSEAHNIAVLVGKNLELDVARVLDEFLHVEVAITERRRSFLLCLR